MGCNSVEQVVTSSAEWTHAMDMCVVAVGACSFCASYGFMCSNHTFHLQFVEVTGTAMVVYGVKGSAAA